MMMNFFSVFSSKAVQPQSARPSESPRNWRCQLGTFWQDIEEAGSVLKARRLVPSDDPRPAGGRDRPHRRTARRLTRPARSLRRVLEFAENPCDRSADTDLPTGVMSSDER